MSYSPSLKIRQIWFIHSLDSLSLLSKWSSQGGIFFLFFSFLIDLILECQFPTIFLSSNVTFGNLEKECTSKTRLQQFLQISYPITMYAFWQSLHELTNMSEFKFKCHYDVEEDNFLVMLDFYDLESSCFTTSNMKKCFLNIFQKRDHS